MSSLEKGKKLYLLISGEQYRPVFQQVLEQSQDLVQSRCDVEQLSADGFHSITNFTSRLFDDFMDKLCELVAPIYAEHLTEEELDELIAFYESAVMKKLAIINVTDVPKILAELFDFLEKYTANEMPAMIDQMFDEIKANSQV